MTDPFQVVREALNRHWRGEHVHLELHRDALAALDQAEAELEGHRENADVLAAMTAAMRQAGAERDRLRAALKHIATFERQYGDRWHATSEAQVARAALAASENQ